MTITDVKNDSSCTGERTDTGCPKIGRKIKEFRLVRGLTQGDLGNKVGVSFQQIQKYESGKNSISAQMLQAIAEVLSVDVVALFPSHENLPTALHEESNFEHKDDESSREILELVREYKEIKSQESRKAVRSLVRSLSSSQ
ncbi:helix-turn-helix transcriptional regulator [Wolbachia endosymbiont (group E) of Neria commutata]|uniref:helix-turn-helix domain-containing protein n=1 Tax=Wolbachia endosymbiont (group E) of Neria commutata TaxID=3066149 RepID=UPI00313324CE